MERNGEHHVARIDDTVTSANLHERAEAVAVPDFDYLEQTFEAIADVLTRPRKGAPAHVRRGQSPDTGTADASGQEIVPERRDSQPG